MITTCNESTTGISSEFFGEWCLSQMGAIQLLNPWEENMLLMHEQLDPRAGDNILEIGVQSSFFSYDISKCIGDEGQLFLLYLSKKQPVHNLSYKPSNIKVLQSTVHNVELPEGTLLNKIWSWGSMHHVTEKTNIFRKLKDFSREGAKLIICDIFSGTKLANYFDNHVAKVCLTGHEVNFLSRGFAKSLCYTTGWAEPVFDEISLQWKFSSKKEIGTFLSLLHCNKPEFSPTESLANAEKYLGVKKVKNGYHLNWPMTLMITTNKPKDTFFYGFPF